MDQALLWGEMERRRALTDDGIVRDKLLSYSVGVDREGDVIMILLVIVTRPLKSHPYKVGAELAGLSRTRFGEGGEEENA